MTTTIADLARATGISPLDHLDLGLDIPVHAGPQSQGDVRVRQLSTVRGVRVRDDATWITVPPEGLAVVSTGPGGHDHVLTPGEAPVYWTAGVLDLEDLATGAFRSAAPCYLYHMEHGGQGYAPGEYLVRRQREQADMQRLVAD